MYSLFDELDDLFKVFDGSNMTASKSRYSVPSFPPCNVMLDKEGSMILEFALAGYSKEDLKIDYKDNQLILSTVENYKGKINTEVKFLANGIKTPSFKYSYFVPEKKFKITDLNASFENGMLNIKIPARAEEEKTSLGFTIK